MLKIIRVPAWALTCTDGVMGHVTFRVIMEITIPLSYKPSPFSLFGGQGIVYKISSR